MSRLRTSRVELATLKRRRALVGRGIEILTRKKDALMDDFTKAIKEAHDARLLVERDLERAVRSLAGAMAAESPEEVMATALAAQTDLSIEIETHKKWGAPLPELVWFNPHRSPMRRGSAPGFRSPQVDVTAGKFETALETLAALGVAEARALSLGAALKKTGRMLTMLDTVVLPKVEADIALVVSRLEEREREERFRMKRFKRLRTLAGLLFLTLSSLSGVVAASAWTG